MEERYSKEYQAFGRVALHAALLEHLMVDLASHLLCPVERDRGVVVASVLTFRQAISVAQGVTRRCFPAHFGEWHRAFDAADRAIARRNRLLHSGYYTAGAPPRALFRFKRTVDGKGRYKPQKNWVGVAELATIADEIEAAQRLLVEAWEALYVMGYIKVAPPSPTDPEAP